MLNNKNIFYFEIWVIKNADTFFSQMKILHRSCGEVSLFHKVGIEKWGFFTGLEIFILLFLQFKGIMALPGKGDIGERRNERRAEKEEKERTRKIRARRKRQKRRHYKGSWRLRRKRRKVWDRGLPSPLIPLERMSWSVPLPQKDGPVIFPGKVTRSKGKLNP